ncbi:hypothetical protein KGD82_13820 [Nocardiopsis eucommiae]|uniref:Uncharacterized protein n=1 Tax=Nocardiopsis eucommiae TaxID=2831970 RepID=A0A975L6T2_9ACTN|nr:hypothetical protein KGD82_13820 [Nocardiopsis eucommiae]
MGWFSKSDDERQAEQDRESRRAISRSKASQLAWAEKEVKKDPDNKLAQGILDYARRNL